MADSTLFQCQQAIKNGIDTPSALNRVGWNVYTVQRLLDGGYIELVSGRYRILKEVQTPASTFTSREQVIKADMQRILEILANSGAPLTQTEVTAQHPEINRSRFRTAIQSLENQRLVFGRRCSGGRAQEYALKRRNVS